MLYGYIVKNDGSITIDPEQADKVEQLFRRFADGETLTYSCEGLPMAPQTCKKMLSTSAYLGDASRPAIIPQSLFARVQSELVRRGSSRKPKTQPMKIPVWPVHLHFTVSPDTHTGLTPQEMYEMVTATVATSTAGQE